MKVARVVALCAVLAGCANAPQESRPYGMEHTRQLQEFLDLQAALSEQARRLEEAEEQLRLLRASQTLPNIDYSECFFCVTDADQSLIGLLIRWAKADGREIWLNGYPVESLASFRWDYVDYPLTPATRQISATRLDTALQALAGIYAGKTRIPISIVLSHSRIAITSKR